MSFYDSYRGWNIFITQHLTLVSGVATTPLKIFGKVVEVYKTPLTEIDCSSSDISPWEATSQVAQTLRAYIDSEEESGLKWNYYEKCTPTITKLGKCLELNGNPPSECSNLTMSSELWKS